MTPGLIERLEAAGEGSRELDAEIARLFGGQAIARFGDWDCREDGTGIWRPLPRYSSSLDAALALAERVLPDLTKINVWTYVRGKHHHCEIETDEDEFDALNASTPALALCIAILKARATQEQTHG